MREIRFRAWDKQKKQMLEIRELTFLVDDGNPLCVEAWEPDAKEKTNAYLITLAPETFELMQFTGLKDRHGKEIYEGDVVKCVAEKEYIGEVQFDEQQGAWIILWQPNNKKQKSGCDNLASTWPSPLKDIIGNIYENPELNNQIS